LLFRITALADLASSRRAPSNEGLISLNRLAEAAHLRAKERLAHRCANAVHQEPCRFQADAEHPVKLVRAHPLLRHGKQVHRLEPYMERDLAALHDGSDRDCELLAASVALETPGTMLLAEHPSYALPKRAAVRAFRAIRPDPRL